jgi:SOS response regulatory protein OraA/RecX
MSSNKCLNYFLFILGKKDYSVEELWQKGGLKNYSSAEVEESLQVLVGRNFVNDTRLAENLILTYQSKKGINWIKQKLKTRLINSEIIEKTLQENQPNPDLVKLKEKLVRKYKISESGRIEYAVKVKIINYLASHGFTDSWGIFGQMFEGG